VNGSIKQRAKEQLMMSLECIVCESNEAEVAYKPPDILTRTTAKYKVMRCLRCGMMFTNPQPSDEDLALCYEADSYYAYKVPAPSFLRQQLNALLDLTRKVILEDTYKWQGVKYRGAERFISTFVKPAAWLLRDKVFYYALPWVDGGRILDVGCSTGETFLKRIRDISDKWYLKGVEMNPVVAQRGRDEFGLDILTGLFEQVDLPESSFDIITMHGFLEHVRNPVGMLRKARRLLKSNGLLVLMMHSVESPFLEIFGPDWVNWEIPRHLYHFSERTLRTLLERNGFLRAEIRHTSVRYEFHPRHEVLESYRICNRNNHHCNVFRLLTRTFSCLVGNNPTGHMTVFARANKG